MYDQDLVDELRTSGRVSAQQVKLWGDAAGLMAALDAIGREGANAIVKIDGARLDGAIYTVLISGPRLGEAFFRQDGSDLAVLLRAAIEFYKGIAW